MNRKTVFNRSIRCHFHFNDQLCSCIMFFFLYYFRILFYMKHIEEEKKDMRFHLFLLLVFSSYQHFTFTNALFDYNNNTSLDIELHQCDTNITLVHNITITIDQRFDSCKLNCCIKNQSSIFQNFILFNIENFILLFSIFECMSSDITITDRRLPWSSLLSRRM